MLGRELRMPLESWIDDFLDKNKDIDEYVKGLCDALKHCWENCELKVMKNFEQYTKPRQAREPRLFKEFEVGDLVYRKVVPKSVYKYYLTKKEYKILKKLNHRYCGPFQIIKKWSPVRYTIAEHRKEKEVHALNLKRAPPSNRLAIDG